MNDQNINQDFNANEPAVEEEPTPVSEKSKVKSPDPLKGAWKQVENIGQTLGEALQGRGNVVMVRVNNETLERLDMLIEAEIVKSRSEAAALLINEGAKSFQSLFDRVRTITDQIAQLRMQLRETVQKESETDPTSPNSENK